MDRRVPLLLALLGLLVPVGLASAAPPRDAVAAEDLRFVEIPGRRMLSGRLVARPLQPSAQMRRGRSRVAAERRAEDARRRLDAWRIKAFPEVDEHILLVPAGRTEEGLAGELAATGLYEYVEPDWLVAAAVVPNDLQYPQQWHLPVIGAEQAWDLATGDGAAIVAVCDSGVQLDHPDLMDRLVPGYNVIDDLAQVDGGDVDGLTDHGTQVAGAAAAAGNNAIGVSGVGWDLRVMPIRVRNTPDDLALMSDINDGARWAVDHGALAVNASFTGVQNASVQTTGRYIREQGGTYVWAAGNASFALNYFDHADVIIVGATDQNDDRAEFSNFGAAIDLVAPGLSIMTTMRFGQYGAESGTSFAAPIIAGALALVHSANSALSPAQAELVLLQTAVDLGEPGDDDVFGRGRLDLAAAVQLAVDAMTTPLAPQAADDAGYGSSADPILVDVLANDIDLNQDALAISGYPATTPSGGTVELVTADGPGARDQLLVTPLTDFEGVESFSYEVSDPAGLTATATVTIAIAHAPQLAEPTLVTVSSGVANVASGDFDGDTDPDLAVVSTIPLTPLQLVENVGGGQFVPLGPVDLGDELFSPSDLAAIDLDADGLDDLVLTDAFGDKIGWYLSQGELSVGAWGGLALEHPELLRTRAADGAAFDLNSDGLPDAVVVSGGFPAEVVVLRNDASGGLSTLQQLAGPTVLVDLAVGDVTGDGKHDIVAIGNLGSVRVYRGLGGALFQAGVTTEISLATTSMILADIEQDGDLDLVISGTVGQRGLWALENTGDGSFESLLRPVALLSDAEPSAPDGLFASDLDRDGVLDLVVGPFFASPDRHDVAMAVGAGTYLPTAIPVPMGEGSAFGRETVPVDLDGDGDDDWVSLVSNLGSKLEIRLNESPPPPPLPGDVDGDGSVDVDDLVAVVLAWGPCPPPPDDCPADLDASGAVDVDDLVEVLLNWGP